MLQIIIYRILFALINVYELILIARALISWFPIAPDNPIVSFLYTVTEPVLEPVRKLLFKIPALQNIPIDFSIIVVFMLLSVLRGFI